MSQHSESNEVSTNDNFKDFCFEVLSNNEPDQPQEEGLTEAVMKRLKLRKEDDSHVQIERKPQVTVIISGENDTSHKEDCKSLYKVAKNYFSAEWLN